MKAFRQVSKSNNGDVITLGWASDTASQNLDLVLTIADRMVLEDDSDTREKLRAMLGDALSKSVMATQIAAVLMGEERVAHLIFGDTPVEIVDVEPEKKAKFTVVYSGDETGCYDESAFQRIQDDESKEN